MRKPTAIQLDRSIAQTAFALSGACDDARGVTLEIRRAGSILPPLRFEAAEFDDDGRAVFIWDARLFELQRGLYGARFSSGREPCGSMLLYLGERCEVRDAVHTERAACGPIDATQPGCTPRCAEVCAPAPRPVIYVPPYDVPRGC